MLGSLGQVSLYHLQSIDIKQAHIFTVHGMEVGRWMISEEQLYNDSIKSGDFRLIVSQQRVP